jgi:hypothetical protein
MRGANGEALPLRINRPAVDRAVERPDVARCHPKHRLLKGVVVVAAQRKDDAFLGLCQRRLDDQRLVNLANSKAHEASSDPVQRLGIIDGIFRRRMAQSLVSLPQLLHSGGQTLLGICSRVGGFTLAEINICVTS